jgi:hypothetical protein
MFTIAMVLAGLLMLAVLCAIWLIRPARNVARAPEASPMKATLERRLRDGAEFPF